MCVILYSTVLLVEFVPIVLETSYFDGHPRIRAFGFMLHRLTPVMAAIALLAYLYLKLWDWAATSYYSHAPGTADALARLQATTPYSQSFWVIEVFLGIVVPVIILLNRPLRRHIGLLIVALVLVVAGVVVNRWNVTLSGLTVPPQWSPGVLGHVVAATYTPSAVEVMVSLGILAFALLLLTLGVKYLPLFSEDGGQHH